MEFDVGATWERRHTNGWQAYVMYEGKGHFRYSVMNANVPRPGRGGVHIAGSLTDLQALADDDVPDHECACGGWVSRG